MQNVAVGTSAPSEDRNGLCGAIVSDLVSLIECVRASMELIDAAVAGQAPLGYQEIGANVVILDDVTPGYVRARGIEQLRSPSWSGHSLSRGYQDTAAWNREASRVLRPAHPMGRA